MPEDIAPAPKKLLQQTSHILLTLKDGLSSLLAFEITLKVITAIVFTPLVAWLLATLMAWSGSGAVSNYDLTSFFLSPKGILFGSTAATLAFAILFFEFGGLTALWIALQKGRHLQPTIVLPFLVRALLRLWKLSVYQFVRYLLVGLPSLAVVGVAYMSFLTKNDINYYLQTKPADYWWAVSIGGVAAVVYAILALKLFLNWIFSVPILLFESRTPAEALRESKALAQGRHQEILKLLGKWLLLFVCISIVVGMFMSILSELLMRMAGDHVRLALAASAWLAVLDFLVAVVVSGTALILLACLVGERYEELRPDHPFPFEEIERKKLSLPPLNKLIPAGWGSLLILCLLLTALASYRIIHKINFDHDITITAHRGSSVTAPENTMAAITQAMDEGADVIEIDVQETRDGVVVLLHDKDLKRVTGLDKGIWEVSYDEIKDLDIGSWFDKKFAAERVSTLKEVIETVRGRCQLNIELKFNSHAQDLAVAVVRIVQEENFLDQCVLTSLKYEGLLEAKAADPRVRTGLIVTASVGDVTKLNVDFLSVSAASVNRNLLKRAHMAGKEVHVWTVNNVDQMNTMIGLGVDSIITDVPGLLADLKTERASLSKAEKTLLLLDNLPQRRFN